MLKRYAAAGLTSIGDRGTSAEAFALYNILKKQNRLPLRVVMTARLRPDEIERSTWTTGQGDEWLKWGSFKVGLDGGMNAGTAYMREPYGPFGAQLFGIDDPHNHGVINFTPDELLKVMRAAYNKGWQLSAHSQGGGAVDALLHSSRRSTRRSRSRRRGRTGSTRASCPGRDRACEERSACSSMCSPTGCTSTA